MIRVYITILFLAVLTRSNGQIYFPSDFPTDSVQWTILSRTNGTTLNSSITHTYQYLMSGDTLINGFTYQKIYKDTIFNITDASPLHAFLRQDTLNKVYVRYPLSLYNDTTEYVLYDFSLMIGDTFTYKSMYDNSWNKLLVVNQGGPNNVNYPGNYSIIFLRVTPDNWGFCEMYYTECGSRIGMKFDLFYNEIPWNVCTLPWDDHHLNCFFYQGVQIAGGACDIHTGYAEEPVASGYNISEEGDFITIKMKNAQPQPVEISLYDLAGRIVYADSFSGTAFNISKQGYSPGLYALVLRTGAKMYTVKILL